MFQKVNSRRAPCSAVSDADGKLSMMSSARWPLAFVRWGEVGVLMQLVEKRSRGEETEMVITDTDVEFYYKEEQKRICASSRNDENINVSN